jgi:hypothetical protein
VNETLQSPDQPWMGTLRDALCLISAAERGDGNAVQTMLASYNGPAVDMHERGALLGALLAHAVAILRAASMAAGVAPEAILGAVAASL